MNHLVSHIYLINLPSRADRLQRALQECSKNSIRTVDANFTIFPAISKEDGAEGLFYTMLAIFEQAYEAGHTTICLLEDDVRFVMPPQLIVEKCLNELAFLYRHHDMAIHFKPWDMLHLGPNTQIPFRQFISKCYLLPLQNGLATHAVIYSRECIKKILDMDLVWEGIPIDKILADQIQRDGLSYCTYPLLATQHDDYSDIEKEHVTYNHIENKFYKNVSDILDK